MKRLALGTVAVAGTWTALQFHTSSPTDRIDTALLGAIGVVFSAIAIVMLTGMPLSTRAVGAFYGVLGVAVVFGCAAWVREFGPYLTIHRSDGRVYHQGISPEWVQDFGRACLVVGGPLLLVGVIRWWRNREIFPDPADADAP